MHKKVLPRLLIVALIVIAGLSILASIGFIREARATTYISDTFATFATGWTTGSDTAGRIDKATDQYHGGSASVYVNTTTNAQYGYAYRAMDSTPTGNYHVQFWVYASSAVSAQYVILTGHYDTVAAKFNFKTGLNCSGGVFYLQNCQVDGAPGTWENVAALTNNTWTLIDAYYLNTSGLVHYYKTGVKQGGDFAALNAGSGTNRLYIGDASGTSMFAKFYLDDLVIDDAAEASDTAAPTYSTIGSNATARNTTVLCYVLWADTYGVSGFIFSTNNTGAWVNETWSSSASWGNKTFTLNTTMGEVVQWKEWANDTSNNWNSTATQSITVTGLKIDGCQAVDLDVGNTTIYAGYKYYSFSVNVSLTPALSAMQYIDLRFSTVSESWVRWCEDNASFYIVNAAGYMWTTGSTNATSGNQTQLTFKAMFSWSWWTTTGINATVYAIDSANVSLSSAYSLNMALVKTVSASTPTLSTTRTNPGGSLTMTGNLTYAGSSVLVPNDQFITNGVQIHNNSKTFAVGTVNPFNYTFSIQTSLGSDTYHVSFDGADGGFPDTEKSAASPVIRDQVNITLSAADSRINIGSLGVVNAVAIYSYDSVALNGTVTLNDTLTKSAGGIYYFTVSSISDLSYGLTTFTSNNTSIIYDAVMVFLSIEDNRIDIGSNIYANLNATYAYDGASISDGTITLNGSSMTYQSGSWWRLNMTQSTVGQRTYCVDSVTGNAYGITQLGIISLNGVADRFVIPDHADFKFNAMTVAVWAKPTVSVSDGYLISQYDSGTKDGYNLYQTTDRGDGNAAWIFECLVNGAVDTVYSDSPPVAGAWQHIVGMRDSSGNMKLYVDGVLQVKTGTMAGEIDSTSSVYIGTLFNGLPVVDFDGLLCEHRFYNRELLVAEIYQLYQGRQTNNTGLVALYSRVSYDMADKLWRDLSGNGHDGVIQTVTVIAGLSTDETVRPIWDSLTIYNLQTVQYQGSGNYYYQAQIKYTFDSGSVNGGIVGIALPNASSIGLITSNSSGWVSFVLGQSNITATGTFSLYGVNETFWGITVAGVNQTFVIHAWTLNPVDNAGGSLTNGNVTVSANSTTVWTGYAATLLVPPDTFNASVTWLVLQLNTTNNVNIAANVTTTFNCSVYPLTGIYHFGTNATVASYLYSSDTLTVSFSGVADTYVLLIDKPTAPTFIVNATYDLDTDFVAGSYLALTHYANETLAVSYDSWGDLYVQKVSHKLISCSLSGQIMSITATGTTGDIATLEVYCGSRGNPVSTSGWLATSYSSTLHILTGTLSFASDKTVTMTWVTSGSGPSPGTGGSTTPAIQQLIATVIVAFPLRNTQGTTITANITITWTGVNTILLQEVFIDAPNFAGWLLLVPNGLPQQLTMTGASGTAEIPITLNIPAEAATGEYIVPCVVAFGWQEGAGTKTFRTVSTLEVVVPPPATWDLMTYWWLIMFGGLAVSMLLLRDKTRAAKP